MPLPPTELILGALHNGIIPAAGGAALVLCLFLLAGRWAGALGSAAAVVVAFLAANYTLANVGFGDKQTWENTHRLIPWKTVQDPEVNTPGWHWLPRMALVLVVVGLLSRWAGLLAARYSPERNWWVANVLVWVPRAAAVWAVSAWIASGTAASGPEWDQLRPQLAVTMFLLWVTLDGLARAWPGGQVPAYLALVLMAGGMLLLYAHNARFMEMAVLVGSAMFGVGIAAGVGKADASGSIPAAVAFLPGLMLGARPSFPESNVPAASFWLLALAPLALSPFLIPALSRKNGLIALAARIVLLLIPVVVAIVLAAQNEQLAFDAEY
jgi:MFS family permease